jgi:hypothetical protein
MGWLDRQDSINPLTGLSGLQLSISVAMSLLGGKGSQSPYGAMWFATFSPDLRPTFYRVAIPLRGYVVCNLLMTEVKWGLTPVAIPLRGYVVCNSTPLRMPFWTAPPEGVFVRKMKLGICIGQRMGVLRGLGRREDFGRRGKGECIGEYHRPREKKLAFKVPSRIPGTGTL